MSIPLSTHQFPRSPQIFCAFCLVPSLLLLWTVLQGPHQDLWLCNLLCDGWHEQPLNEVAEALAPNTLVQFLSLPHHSTSLHSTLSTCLLFVQLQSNFRQLLTLHTWVKLSSQWFDYLEQLPGNSLWVAASNSTHMPSSWCCLSTLSFQFLLSVLIFTFCFSLLPDCCINVVRYPFLFLLRLKDPIISLATSIRTVLVPFQRSSGVTSSFNFTWKRIIFRVTTGCSVWLTRVGYFC